MEQRARQAQFCTFCTVLHSFGRASVATSYGELEPLLQACRDVVVFRATAGFCLTSRRNQGDLQDGSSECCPSHPLPLPGTKF